MSAQVKKRFEELAAYLGRDTQGLEKLKRLKDDVGVLRKKLAAAEEKAAREEALSTVARTKADEAVAELARLKVENHSLRQMADGLARQIENEKQKSEPSDGEEIISGDGTCSQMKRVIKSLRKEMNFCPKGPTVQMKGTHCVVFERSVFQKSWSHHDIWMLGAAVAMYSVTMGQITILSEWSIRDLSLSDPDSSPLMRHIVQWMQDNYGRLSQKDRDFLESTGQLGVPAPPSHAREAGLPKPK